MNFVKRLGLKPPDLMGLDVGSSSVKLVQLDRSGGGYKLSAAARVQIDTAEMNDENDSIQASEVRTTRAINECCRQADINNKYAVCGVCGPDVAVRYFKFPVLPAEEVASAIALEADQVCPFSMDDSVMDYQVIPDGSDSIRGVLVAATNKTVKHKSKMVKEASLQPVFMDVDGLALLNCLLETEGSESGRATAVLNVGSTYTTLVITGENCVPFVRDTTHAGENIMKDVIRNTKLSSRRINSVLFDGGGDEEEQMLVEEALETSCKVLIEDVTGTLRFYMAQKKELFVEKIFVCGGFALAKGLVDMLDKGLPAMAVLWNPFEKISFPSGGKYEQFLQKEGPSFAVAAGLAMRSI